MLLASSVGPTPAVVARTGDSPARPAGPQGPRRPGGAGV